MSPAYDGLEKGLCDKHEVNRNSLALHGPETIIVDHGKVDHLISPKFASIYLKQNNFQWSW